MVRLTDPKLEMFVQQQVEAGRFPTREAAIEAAVERVMLEESGLDEDVLTGIDEAENQIERGLVRDWQVESRQLRKEYLGG